MADLSEIANVLGDPGRAAMVLKLMGDVALPAGELARVANVTPQTASGHLARMVELRLLAVEQQGRHRYYRLAGEQVGDAVEALLRLTISTTAEAPITRGATGTLAYARTCYSHLAGWLGVALTEALLRERILQPADAKTFTISPYGHEWFEKSLSLALPTTPMTARRCLDWTERRHHLAGPLGRAFYKRLLDLKWLAPIPNSRAIRITLAGKKNLWHHLRLPLG